MKLFCFAFALQIVLIHSKCDFRIYPGHKKGEKLHHSTLRLILFKIVFGKNRYQYCWVIENKVKNRIHQAKQVQWHIKESLC